MDTGQFTELVGRHTWKPELGGWGALVTGPFSFQPSQKKEGKAKLLFTESIYRYRTTHRMERTIYPLPYTVMYINTRRVEDLWCPPPQKMIKKVNKPKKPLLQIQFFESGSGSRRFGESGTRSTGPTESGSGSERGVFPKWVCSSSRSSL